MQFVNFARLYNLTDKYTDMFENLSERLDRSFKILKGEGKITEVNVAETLKEIRRALLDADVSYKVAKEFCEGVKAKAIGANVLTAVKPQQMMVKIVHDELAQFMGSEHSEINLKGSPAVILIAGLNGSGKTTFSGKLALYLKSKKGMKVLLAACDTFRPAAIEQLKTLIPLGPLHMPGNIMGIECARKLMPNVPQAIVLDTAWHQTMPREAFMYAVPYEWYEKYGIQRLGFHGASHSYIASVLDKEFGEYRAVSCHLGGSGSICAIENGRSVDTSFGLSLETGLIHANRVGDMDPTIVFFLEEQGLSKKEIKEALTKNGGLKGISGVSGDLRYVEKAAEEGNERAQLALDVYIRGIIHYAASFASDMGGLDALVFTAGIGEHSSYVRGKVVEGLSILGLEIDEKANEEGREVISKPSSPVRIMVIPTDEEIVVARKSVEYIINHQ